MHIGIVGAEAAKFTSYAEEQARIIIRALLEDPLSVLVSGHCHLGGIDIWAEEEAHLLGRAMHIFPPKTLSWAAGYKLRNLLIASHSDIVHNLVVATYPPQYIGMRFSTCYHCHTTDHVKSGGCWTAKQCRRHETWTIYQQ